MSIPAGLDLCLFPAGTPPDGQLPNFENPPTYAPTVIAVTVVVLFFAALFTGCRLLANWKKLTWGDCTPLARLNTQCWPACLTIYRSQCLSPRILCWAKWYHACSYVLAILSCLGPHVLFFNLV